MSCLELTDTQVCNIVEPMMDDIMAGVARHDYALHSTHFSVNLKSVITAESFLQSCTQRESDWGLPGDRQLMCIFRKTKFFTVVWDQAYTQDGGQVVALSTVAVKGGRYFVDYFLLH
jgi:hypothetical protein